MGVFDYKDVRVVYVGDTAPAFEFVFLKPNKRDVRDLTGYAAWVTFWHTGSPPHVIRAASVGGATGIVKYELVGDEFDAEDEYGVVFQPTVLAPGSLGNMFFQQSFPPVRRVVKRRPT